MLKRLAKDFKDLHENTKIQEYFVDNSNDMSIINTIIVGPKNTPYEGGFFWIQLKPNERYPFESPKGQFMSPVPNLRVHPNLYCCGKICLSILGTWSGPPWTGMMNFTTVILSIQSILCDNPIINEPGCEKYTKNSSISMSYNKIVKYTTLKMIVNYLSGYYNISKYLQNKIDNHILLKLSYYNNLFEDALNYGITIENGCHYYGFNNVKLDFIKLSQDWKLVTNKFNNLKNEYTALYKELKRIKVNKLNIDFIKINCN